MSFIPGGSVICLLSISIYSLYSFLRILSLRESETLVSSTGLKRRAVQVSFTEIEVTILNPCVVNSFQLSIISRPLSMPDDFLG